MINLNKIAKCADNIENISKCKLLKYKYAVLREKLHLESVIYNFSKYWKKTFQELFGKYIFSISKLALFEYMIKIRIIFVFDVLLCIF